MIFARDITSFVSATSDIAVVRYESLTTSSYAHIVGNGVHLEFASAAPRNWFRAEAQNLCKLIAEAVNGVTWDKGGVQHLVVPRHMAAKVAAKLYYVFRGRISEFDMNALASAAGVKLQSNLEWNWALAADEKIEAPDVTYAWAFDYEPSEHAGKVMLVAKRSQYGSDDRVVSAQQIPAEWTAYRVCKWLEDECIPKPDAFVNNVW